MIMLIVFACLCGAGAVASLYLVQWWEAKQERKKQKPQ